MRSLEDWQRTALEGCGNLEQYCVTRYSYETRRCRLCRPSQEWRTDIFYQGKDVLGVLNEYPQLHSRIHALVFPRRHVVGSIRDLSRSEWSEFFEAVTRACDAFSLVGGGLLARFGDPQFSRGTILHFHMNIVEPDLSGEVRLPLAKRPEDIQRNRDRAGRFSEVYRRLSEAGLLEAFVSGTYDPPEGRQWDGR